MNSFRSVHSAVHAGVAGICWWVLQHMSDLQARIESHIGIGAAAIIALLALLFRTSDGLARVIIEKIPLVSRGLRRVLSGRGWIEGDWPLVVVDMERLVPLYLGFLRIEFRNGQPLVYGDDWSLDGEHAMAFESVQALQSEHMLQYWYKQGTSLQNAELRGFTEIYFFPHRAVAERHAGRFLDPQHTRDIRFYAVRQRYGWLERRIDAKQQKLEAATKLWNELAPRIKTLRERKIDNDFA